MLISTIIIFIIVLGILVFVHELGHFVTAKRAGIRVDEFGFGFPPRIFGVKRGETTYSINAIPLGGFVKIYGEDGEGESDPRSFGSKPLLTRAFILASGVIMNFLLAAVFLAAVYLIGGLPTAIDDNEQGNFQNVQVQISMVSPKSPAEAAGLRLGDTILEMKAGSDVLVPNKVAEIQNFSSNHAGEEVLIKIKRGNNVVENIKAVPRKNPAPDEGRLGVALSRTAIISYPWYESIYMGFYSAAMLVFVILTSLWDLLYGLLRGAPNTADQLSGPVGIAVLTGQVAELGFVYLLRFTALLSVNLAVVNALPFPALDGGRILFLIIEKIKGVPVSQKLESTVHVAGMALLILLMLIVTVKDIFRFDIWDRVIKLFT